MSHRATHNGEDKGVTQPLSGSPHALPRKAAKYYAVASGRERGIYSTWQQCSARVTGHPGACFQSFTTLQAARDFLQQHPMVSSPASSSVRIDAEDGSTAAMQCTHTGLSDAAAIQPACKTLRAARDKADIVDDGPEAKRRRPDGLCEAVQPSRQALPTASSLVSCPADLCCPSSSSPSSSVAALVVQEVYVDGACRQNGRSGAHGGYGGFYGSHEDRRNFALPLTPTEPQTNNRAELHAVLRAIQQGFVDAGTAACFDLTTVPTPPSLSRPLYQLRIFTDSRYVVEGWRRHSARWLRNGFRLANGAAVLNQDLWRHLLALRAAYNRIYARQRTVGGGRMSTRDEKRQHECDAERTDEGVTIFHVRGHANVFGNVVADQLAVEGAMKVEQEDIITI